MQIHLDIVSVGREYISGVVSMFSIVFHSILLFKLIIIVNGINISICKIKAFLFSAKIVKTVAGYV